MATADSSSLAIAQRLPSDIISENFKYFHAPKVPFPQLPWHLAHVCSSWRNGFLTILRSSRNKFIVHLNNARTKEEDQRRLDMLTTFLECNRGRPFSFELGVASGNYTTTFNLLVSVSPWWQKVTLKIRSDDIPGLNRVKGKLEHLEYLSFDCADGHSAVLEAFTDSSLSCPRLTHFSSNRLSTWTFNWSIMTFMDLGCHKREEIALVPSILSQALRLETLIVDFGNEPLPPIASIMLPSLLSLSTKTISLIQAVTTPSLKELRVDFGRVDPLKSFFSRSRCRLRSLRLQYTNAASAIEILSQTPDLESLHLGCIHNSTEVIGWLNGIDRVETPKLTCLQSLAVLGYHPWDQMRKIFDFIAQRGTRVGSTEKLQKLMVTWDWEPDEEEFGEQLRKTCKLYDIQYSGS